MKKTLYPLIVLGALVLIYGCRSNNQRVNLDANRQVVKKYHEIWTNGKVEELDKIIASDFVCHFIGGLEWKGIDGAKNSISNHKKSFPGWTEEIVDIIAERDKVVTRY